MQESSQKLLIVVGASAIAWVVSLVVGMALINAGFGEAKLQHENLRMKIKEFEEKNIQFEQASNLYQKANENIERINKNFVGSDGILDLLIKLENEAKNTHNTYNVEVSQDVAATPASKTQKETADKKTPALPGTVLRTNLTGTFTNIFQFLYNVHQLNHFFQIQRVTIKQGSATGAPQENLLNATLVIKVYSPPPQ